MLNTCFPIWYHGIQGVGFIGSTKTGKLLYELVAKEGKRASINAGAKNHIVVMPDADMLKTAEAVASHSLECPARDA